MQTSYHLENEVLLNKKKKQLMILLSLIGLVSIGILLSFSSIVTNGIGKANSGHQAATEAPLEGPESGPLYRVVLPEHLVCNDNTEAVYYRSYAPEGSPNADKWIIEFEGGGSCGGINSCNSRWNSRPNDMTTKTEEEDYFDTSGGLINSYEVRNPLFWNWSLSLSLSLFVFLSLYFSLLTL